MRRILSFMNVSLDGYFADSKSDISWAHLRGHDPEWNSFVEENARGGGLLLFGRVTYDMMKSYWPTEMAAQQNPVVAQRMNEAPKLVASRTLKKSDWQSTQVINGDFVEEIKKLKESPGEDIAILGSGSIVSQLTDAGLIDTYQVVVHPTVLGAGKSLFGGVNGPRMLQLGRTRQFGNGNMFLEYAPAR
jgi:dihydrofolate reductase